MDLASNLTSSQQTTIILNTTSSCIQTCFPRLDSSWTTQKETWNGLIAPSHFVHLGVWNLKEFNAMEDMFHIQVKVKLFGEDWLKCFATEILDAKYEKTDATEVIKELTHLNAHQKADLLWVLQENEKIFDEILDIYPHKRVHIDIDPNAKSVHTMPSPVSWIHLKTFNKEIDHLVGLGVLAPQ